MYRFFVVPLFRFVAPCPMAYRDERSERAAAIAEGYCRCLKRKATRGNSCDHCYALERARFRNRNPKARIYRCSKCWTPGHTVKTCPVDADKLLFVRSQNAAIADVNLTIKVRSR